MLKHSVIVWFRQDLRLRDHSALIAAAVSGAPVIPVYILDDELAGAWSMGSASRWWLHHSLLSLRNSLHENYGVSLIFRRGKTLDVLLSLASECEAKEVYWSRGHEPYMVRFEQVLAEQLNRVGVDSKRFGGQILFAPETIKTQSGEPFKVFTPFWKKCWRVTHEINSELSSRPAPKQLTSFNKPLRSELLDDWHLLPTQPYWAGGLQQTWQPGEAGAQKRVKDFLSNELACYATARDRPDQSGTSRVSPHLHFGEISARELWQQVVAYRTEQTSPAHKEAAESYLRELVWREFSYYLLFHFQDFPEQPFRKEFLAFPWRYDQNVLTRWKKGLTGYPIVDAGMRELWHTGWMHNRVRMIAASFLVKDLLIPWQEGERWFWDTLVDADLASNSASWQWVAGCGADAAPYFRIFNPTTQGIKFDPQGEYVRRWVPEIAGLPNEVIHAPWQANNEQLISAGVRLGDNYPQPVVDHSRARQQALDAYKGLRRSYNRYKQ